VEDRERWVPGEKHTAKYKSPEKKNTAHVQLMALLSLVKSVGQKKQGHVIGKLHFCGSRYHGPTVRGGSVTRTKHWQASGTHSTMTAVMPE
jgi:hypothetical protein